MAPEKHEWKMALCQRAPTEQAYLRVFCSRCGDSQQFPIYTTGDCFRLITTNLEANPEPTLSPGEREVERLTLYVAGSRTWNDAQCGAVYNHRHLGRTFVQPEPGWTIIAERPRPAPKPKLSERLRNGPWNDDSFKETLAEAADALEEAGK